MGEQRDRHEVLLRVERHLRIERGVRGEAAGGADGERVAVGIRLGERRQADVAAGAGPVVDDDLLAEPFAELGRDDAHGRVGRAARAGR